MPAAKRILIPGPSSAGKSTLARQIFHAPFGVQLRIAGSRGMMLVPGARSGSISRARHAEIMANLPARIRGVILKSPPEVAKFINDLPRSMTAA
jgi:adenylate kinase family enzyme